jgi:hypothetical protein
MTYDWLFKDCVRRVGGANPGLGDYHNRSISDIDFFAGPLSPSSNPALSQSLERYLAYSQFGVFHWEFNSNSSGGEMWGAMRLGRHFSRANDASVRASIPLLPSSRMAARIAVHFALYRNVFHASRVIAQRPR